MSKLLSKALQWRVPHPLRVKNSWVAYPCEFGLCKGGSLLIHGGWPGKNFQIFISSTIDREPRLQIVFTTLKRGGCPRFRCLVPGSWVGFSFLDGRERTGRFPKSRLRCQAVPAQKRSNSPIILIKYHSIIY